MKKPAIYLIAIISVFAIGWSMIINNNINEIKKELDQVSKEQKNIDLQIRLKEAELAFLINPKNLKNLYSIYLNLTSRPISNAENLISNLNNTWWYQLSESIIISRLYIISTIIERYITRSDRLIN